MGIGASVFLLALGAILAFAVDYTVSGVDINVIGFILMGWLIMIAGGILAVLPMPKRQIGLAE